MNILFYTMSRNFVDKSQVNELSQLQQTGVIKGVTFAEAFWYACIKFKCELF